jgi:hypothetical protein
MVGVALVNMDAPKRSNEKKKYKINGVREL